MDGLMFDTERLCALAWDEAGRQLGIGPAGYMNRKTLGLALPMARKIWRETFGEKVDFDQLDRLDPAPFLTVIMRNTACQSSPGCTNCLHT